MRFLPIVERELRVAAHHPKTWWRRVLTVAACLVVLAFVTLTLGRMAAASWLGRDLFVALSIVGLFFALLAGPLTTADCIGRERREGTLGLLFLTRLRSYDVVLGKLTAASLDMLLSLAATLPLAALPFLLGGLSLRQFAYVALTVGNVVVLSLALGLCASAWLQRTRAALATTLGVLLFLTIGLPLLVEGLGLVPRSWLESCYLLCPSYTLHLALDFAPRRGPGSQLWVKLAAQHAVAWLLLVLACHRTGQTWREQPLSARFLRLRHLLQRLGRARPAARLAWRGAMLQRNPVAWMEGRDLLQERVLWALCLCAAVFLATFRLRSPAHWPSSDWLIAWGLCSQYALCLWLALQAPRRLADDKESGALELLLCTPTSTVEIVRGNLLLLRRRFGRAMVVLMLLDGFLLFAYESNHGSGLHGSDELIQIAAYAFVVFPVQLWSLARVGLYQGLVSSWRASFWLLGKVGLLPWLLFLAFVVSWESTRRYMGLPGLNDALGFGVWGLAHLLPCILFVAHANWHLRRNFRALVAASHVPHWWQRRHRPQFPPR